MNSSVVKAFVVSDANVTITLHGQVAQFPPGIKPEDFYIALMARYGTAEARKYHFTISISEQFDLNEYTPKTLRTYLQTMFQEVLDLPSVIEKYGRLVTKSDIGQLRSRLYDCVAMRLVPVRNKMAGVEAVFY